MFFILLLHFAATLIPSLHILCRVPSCDVTAKHDVHTRQLGRKDVQVHGPLRSGLAIYLRFSDFHNTLSVAASGLGWLPSTIKCCLQATSRAVKTLKHHLRGQALHCAYTVCGRGLILRFYGASITGNGSDSLLPCQLHFP